MRNATKQALFSGMRPVNGGFVILLVCAVVAGLAMSTPAAQRKHNKRGPRDTREEYYYGQAVYSSTDGAREYGQTFSLAKRRIDPAAGKITETVLQSSIKKGGKAAEFLTEMKRSGPTSVFQAADKGGTFTGTVTFAGGSAWEWTGWVYDIRLIAGGTITGRGELVPGGLRTEKWFTGNDGSGARVTETLRAVTPGQYSALHQHMLGVAGIE